MGHAGPKYCVQRMKGLRRNGTGRGIDSRCPTHPRSCADEWVSSLHNGNRFNSRERYAKTTHRKACEV